MSTIWIVLVLSEPCVGKNPNKARLCCVVKTRAMGKIWIVLKSQTRAMRTIWSVLFFTNQNHVYYLDHLFYSALKSKGARIMYEKTNLS